jgi:hypothetical protein
MNDVAAGMERIAAALTLPLSDAVAACAVREVIEEWFEPHNPRHRNNLTRLGIRRLASPDKTWVILPMRGTAPFKPTRDAALRLSIARAIRRFRGYTRTKDGEGVHWSPEYAGRVIEWALSIAPPRVPRALRCAAPAACDASEKVDYGGNTIPPQPEREGVTVVGFADPTNGEEGRRLEGWKQTPSAHPSFETAAQGARPPQDDGGVDGAPA